MLIAHKTDQLNKTDQLKTKKLEILNTYFDVDSFHDSTNLKKINIHHM